MIMNEIYAIVLTAAIGTGGICGIVFYFFRRSIEKILDRKEREEQNQREIRKRRRTIEDELWHSAGRLFFWINRWAETNEHNGELRDAFAGFKQAEEAKKQLDRDIIAEHEGD